MVVQVHSRVHSGSVLVRYIVEVVRQFTPGWWRGWDLNPLRIEPYSGLSSALDGVLGAASTYALQCC